MAHDFELQEYFKEVSANGTGPDGGRGKVRTMIIRHIFVRSYKWYF